MVILLAFHNNFIIPSFSIQGSSSLSYHSLKTGTAVEFCFQKLCNTKDALTNALRLYLKWLDFFDSQTFGRENTVPHIFSLLCYQNPASKSPSAKLTYIGEGEVHSSSFLLPPNISK